MQEAYIFKNENSNYIYDFISPENQKYIYKYFHFLNPRIFFFEAINQIEFLYTKSLKPLEQCV